MPTAKVKIDKELLNRAERCAREQGYSSVEEFVAHLVERAVKEHEGDAEAVEERLRGLGYLE
jgi:metal-responsive CopG/Arc/MetJ family transcriptional regulator